MRSATRTHRFGPGPVWAAVGCALLAGAIAGWRTRAATVPVPTELLSQAPPAAGPARPPNAEPSRAPATPLPARQALRRVAAARAAEASAPASAALAQVSKSEQVRALVASGRPADAFSAYRLLSWCAVVKSLQAAEDGDRAPGERSDDARVQEQCGDLTDTQLALRVGLLGRAADAHVPGAVAALLEQGPQGQPAADIWDDPAYADWRRQTLQRVQAEAERGDAVALQMMIGQHDHGQQPLGVDDSAAALKYHTAYVDIELATDPLYASPTRREALGMQARRLAVIYGAALSAEQVQAAIAAGHALSAACCGS